MATLRIVRGATAGTQLLLQPGITVIGRNPHCDLVVPDTSLNRQHARVFCQDGLFALEDLQSRNGTDLNGRQLRGLVSLQDGDRIRLADVEAVFESPGKALTEEVWLTAVDAQCLLTWLRAHTQVSERQLRLFAVACYRHWGLPWPEERSGLFAVDAERLFEEHWPTLPGEIQGPLGLADAWEAAVESARQAAERASCGRMDRWAAFVEAEGLLCRLVRDVFGNPFRTSPPFEPAWREGLVKELAQAAYDDRELPEGTLKGDRLAALAEAVEEAGCTDQLLLDHLRGQGPHVRACWALNAIRGDLSREAALRPEGPRRGCGERAAADILSSCLEPREGDPDQGMQWPVHYDGPRLEPLTCRLFEEECPVTEDQWLSSNEPLPMLEFLRDSDLDVERKLTLFGAACCRRACRLLDANGWAVVDATEQFADGLIGQVELRAAVWASRGTLDVDTRTAVDSAAVGAWRPAVTLLAAVGGRYVGLAREQAAQADLLRCVLGPLPFRPPSVEVRWRTPAVLSLAQAAYEERVTPDPSRPNWLVLDPARLLVLADCLEEVGADPGLLGHLRRPGEHVRGCWCVDLILERP